MTASSPEDLSALKALIAAYEAQTLRTSPRFTATVLMLPISPRYARLLLRIDKQSLPKMAVSLASVGLLSGLAATLAAGRGVCGWYVLLIFLTWLARRVSSPLIAVVGSVVAFSLLFVSAWTPGDFVSIGVMLAAGLYGADMPGV